MTPELRARTSRVGRQASIGLAALALLLFPASAEAAVSGPQLLTFDNYEIGTSITDQYEGDGVLFSGGGPGEDPEIRIDESNDTSPVLGGYLSFFSPIHAQFVAPGTTTPASVSELQVDVGYIDDPGAIQLVVDTTSGPTTLYAEEFGINHLSLSAPNITGFQVEEVEEDENGFAIDNLAYTVPAPPPPPPPPAPPACPSYLVVDSRGSGETHSDDGKRIVETSPPGASFLKKLQDLHPKASFKLVKNPYPAVGLSGGWRDYVNGLGAILEVGKVGAYHDSVIDGKKWLTKEIRALATDPNCAGKTKVFLVGYSQGAQVTGDVYQGLAADKQDSHLLKGVAGVALFGDPYFNHADHRVDRGNHEPGLDGVLGTRPTFTGPVLSYCHKYDPICQGPLSYVTLALHRFNEHENYPPDAAEAAATLDGGHR
ncbi:MAG TPA: cutinase family protein [Solirubrobacterales bacterium]|nr:cutinase family protein [Solirubrobacterales bacterium]